jgi:hypothetical protein
MKLDYKMLHAHAPDIQLVVIISMWWIAYFWIINHRL